MTIHISSSPACSGSAEQIAGPHLRIRAVVPSCIVASHQKEGRLRLSLRLQRTPPSTPPSPNSALASQPLHIIRHTLPHIYLHLHTTYHQCNTHPTSSHITCQHPSPNFNPPVPLLHLTSPWALTASTPPNTKARPAGRRRQRRPIGKPNRSASRAAEVTRMSVVNDHLIRKEAGIPPWQGGGRVASSARPSRSLSLRLAAAVRSAHCRPAANAQ